MIKLNNVFNFLNIKYNMIIVAILCTMVAGMVSGLMMTGKAYTRKKKLHRYANNCQDIKTTKHIKIIRKDNKKNMNPKPQYLYLGSSKDLNYYHTHHKFGGTGSLKDRLDTYVTPYPFNPLL